MSNMEIIRFGPIRCKHALNARVKLDFCKRKCKLLGAATCPRFPTLGEIIKIDMEGERIGRPVAAR